MKTEPRPPLLLKLDERNLAHFLAALALASLAERIDGTAKDARKCCWSDDGQFAIYSELDSETFRPLLFAKAFAFLRILTWISGLGGAAHGVPVSGNEAGINPFNSLAGDPEERPLLRAFSAKVLPKDVLPQQIKALKSPLGCSWLHQVAKGISSWGFDCRMNMHASDAGISSDAEGTGSRDPVFPVIELLSLTGAAFFTPAHAWSVEDNKLRVAAWTQPVRVSMAALAATGRIHGLPTRVLCFASRGSAHGKGGAYRFFPEATLESSPQQNYE